MNTDFGVIITADEVCQAVADTLQAWLPAVLEQLDNELPPPTDYQQVPDQEAIETANLPTLGVFTPGLDGEPVRDSDGSYDLTWRVVVAGFVRGDDYTSTQRNTRLYAAAISTVLVQQQTLLRFANGTRLISEDFDAVGSGARTLGGAVVEINVTVQGARTELRVPDGPPPLDLSATGVVTGVGVDVRPED